MAVTSPPHPWISELGETIACVRGPRSEPIPPNPLGPQKQVSFCGTSPTPVSDPIPPPLPSFLPLAVRGNPQPKNGSNITTTPLDFGIRGNYCLCQGTQVRTHPPKPSGPSETSFLLWYKPNTRFGPNTPPFALLPPFGCEGKPPAQKWQ